MLSGSAVYRQNGVNSLDALLRHQPVEHRALEIE
jgi:hypothetical protein